MREIKFRAFIKKLGWMLPVERLCFDCNTIEVDLTNGNGDTAEYDFDEVEIMQYTGLIDQDGIAIYECDIVTCDRNINDRFDKTTFEVKFEPTEGFYGESKLGNTVYGEDFNSAKVVGNVHENPELLTKQV